MVRPKQNPKGGQHSISGHAAQGTGIHIVGQHSPWDIGMVMQHHVKHEEAVDTALLDHDGVAWPKGGVAEVEARKVGEQGVQKAVGFCVHGSPQPL